MPAKKASSAKTRSAKTKQAVVPPYGDPLREAIASGDVAKMRRVSASARKWLKDINTLLDKLDQQIKRVSAK